MNVIPYRRIRTIPRQRLLHSLHLWQDLRLVRIIAPAGFGKSTFAAHWARSLSELPEPQRPFVAWVSLFADPDPERFLHSLIESLVGIRPELEDLLTLDGSGELSPAQRMRMLCDALDAAPAPVVLFIDDFHLVTQPPAHALIQQLIDSVHGRFLLVLLSRTTPPLRIDHLILDDAVLTLSERDLAFDHDEFLALMQLLGVDSQPPTLLAQLESRCTGWVTALKLLAHDLHHAPPAAASDLAHLSAGSLQQFIQSRILSLLPDDLREFAACAAFLPWMSAPLLAAATDNSEASCARVLARLVDASAFVTEFVSPTGEPRFRFHPLVQDALRRTTPDDPPARHRAAVWLCDHDLVDEALEVLETDDGRPTIGGRRSAVDPIDSLARATHRALLRFDVVSAQRWLSALPAELLATHASLAVDAAWAAYLSESIPLFNVTLPRAIAAVRCLPAGPDQDALRTEVAVLEVYHHILHGRMDQAARSLADAEAHPRIECSLGNGYLHFMHSLIPHDPSDLDARTRSLQTAADVFECVGHPYGVIETQYCLVLLKRRHLDLPGALSSSVFLDGFAQRHKRSGHGIIRDNLMIRGEMLYAQNRIAEAREIMQRIATEPTYAERSVINVFIARAYLTLCDAAQAADPVAALRFIDEIADADAWARILAIDFKSLHGIVAWPRILRDHRAGRPDRCRQTIESLRVAPAELSDQTPEAVRFSVLAGAVLGKYDHPVLGEQLDALLTYAHATHSRYMSLYVHMLRVMHALMRDDSATALSRLHEVLPDIEQSGMLRVLLDYPVLRPLLQRSNTPFARQMLALFPAAAPPTPLNTLTKQEARILAQLASDVSTKEIAAAFSVTHKTIYMHIHNIFKKLNVHSREEAVRVWQGERRGGRR